MKQKIGFLSPGDSPGLWELFGRHDSDLYQSNNLKQPLYLLDLSKNGERCCAKTSLVADKEWRSTLHYTCHNDSCAS